MTAQATKATHDGDEATGEKVTTYLTGGKSILGGREKPLVAHEVRCSCEGECQFRKDGQCVCVASRLMGLSWCPYGSVTKRRGYTSRARKYHEFERRHKEDPAYMALGGVGHMAYLRLVGDYAYLHLPEPWLTVAEDGKGGRPIGRDGQLRIDSPVFGGTERWLKRELIDVDVIIGICEFVPWNSWKGQPMASYQKKTIPAFVEDLRLRWPEMYAELESVRPDLCGREVDYRGRQARIATLRPGSMIPDSLGNRFVLSDDRTELRCDCFKSALVSVGGAYARGNATVVLPVGEGDTVKVTENDWVVVGETTFS